MKGRVAGSDLTALSLRFEVCYARRRVGGRLLFMLEKYLAFLVN